MNQINLTFINQSDSENNPNIVIFQKNEAQSPDDIVAAWMVIQNCLHGERYPFVFETSTYVSASDNWGNASPLLPAQNGQCFSMATEPQGVMLQLSGDASAANRIEVINNLQHAGANVNIYRSGRLLATKAGVGVGQTAAFAFLPAIWMGIAAGVAGGQLIGPATTSLLTAEISLIGIQSADIVLTGGGQGTFAKPLIFALQNVVYG